MLWFAAVSAGIIMDRNFRRWKIEADAVGMVAITVVAGIVGAKLWHVLDTPSEFREQGWHRRGRAEVPVTPALRHPAPSASRTG